MILDELAAYAKERVEQAKKKISFEEMKRQALALPEGDFAFEKALEEKQMSFICEVKKASPSKGVIAEDFPYLEIAKEYEKAGATCISCLTEPKWFFGSDTIFREIRAQVKIPMIRKDFTVDEYQIYEAKVMGADAVLLICALLDTDTLRKYLNLCKRLGMSALVEAHDETEIASAVVAGAKIIGVNNRNLKDFTVDFSNATNLKSQIPSDVLYVAESGVASVEDVKNLAHLGADAVLMGEVLMRSGDKKQMIDDMRRAAVLIEE